MEEDTMGKRKAQSSIPGPEDKQRQKQREKQKPIEDGKWKIED
ncbi:MAG TPA: hypothetical protein VF889_05285 [Bacteroidota bacterium]